MSYPIDQNVLLRADDETARSISADLLMLAAEMETQKRIWQKILAAEERRAKMIETIELIEKHSELDGQSDLVNVLEIRILALARELGIDQWQG